MDETNKDIIKDILSNILKYFDMEFRVEFKEESSTESKVTDVSVYTQNSASSLIGRNGQNLKALEHLLRILFSKKVQGEHINSITLDINDYRKERAQQAIEMARQAVGRVRNTQKAEALMPMSAYERRIVHTELAGYPDITTESIGEDPLRRIVIKPFP